MKEGIVEIIEMHGDMINGDKECKDSKNHRESKLISNSLLNTWLLTIANTISREMKILIDSLFLHKNRYFIVILFKWIYNTAFEQCRIKQMNKRWVDLDVYYYFKMNWDSGNSVFILD